MPVDEIKIQYSDLNDSQLFVIREHRSWKISNCDYALKFDMLMMYRKRAQAENIEHFL